MSKSDEKRGPSGRTRSEWEGLVAAYERRAVSRRAFCAEAGVSPTTLDYWRKKLKESVAGDFVELAPSGTVRADDAAWVPVAGGLDLELSLGGGVVLKLSRR